MALTADRLAWSRPLFIAGTTLSAFLAGTLCSISIIPIPCLLHISLSTYIKLRLWRSICEGEKRFARPIALAAALMHAANAVIHRDSSVNRSSYFIGAAVSTIAIAPFTILAMAQTEDELNKREQKSGNGNGLEDSPELIQKWAGLNMCRGLLPAVGAVFGFLAL